MDRAGGVDHGTRRPSLKRMLLFIYIFSILLCFSVGFYHVLSTRVWLNQINEVMDQTRLISAIQIDLRETRDNGRMYINSGREDALEDYTLSHTRLWDDAALLEDKVDRSESGVRLKNLLGLIRTCVDDFDRAVEARQKGDTEAYTMLYNQITEDCAIANDYIQSMLALELQNSAEQYEAVERATGRITGVSYVMYAVTLIIVILFALRLSKEVTEPIDRLAGYAKRAAAGEYDITVEREVRLSELAYLYDAFSIMVKNTQLYLEGLGEKRALETELANEKISRLEMDNLLHQTELNALHAQLDPHFIFNTLNIGAQMAALKDDMEMYQYLENAAEVFRYNLEGLSEATLEDEIDHVAAYMGLLTIRVGEKLQYHFHIAEGMNLKKYILPRMTLQPLVENAYVHGVSPCEEGGKIELSVGERDGMAVVTVANTGKTFPAVRMESLYTLEDAGRRGHASGIGLRNVIRRLQLQFQTDRPIEISAGPGYTEVILTVPPGAG